LPVGKYETSSTQQPSEPVGDKNRISGWLLKRVSFAGLGKRKGKVIKEWWAGNQQVRERNLVCES
jgi:hypothetical protein